VLRFDFRGYPKPSDVAASARLQPAIQRLAGEFRVAKPADATYLGMVHAEGRQQFANRAHSPEAPKWKSGGNLWSIVVG
jgi:hypothetical protein